MPKVRASDMARPMSLRNTQRNSSVATTVEMIQGRITTICATKPLRPLMELIHTARQRAMVVVRATDDSVKTTVRMSVAPIAGSVNRRA